jgi:hypothetical protein
MDSDLLLLDEPCIGGERIAKAIGLADADGSVSDTALTMTYGLIRRGILDVDRVGKYVVSTRRRLRDSLAAAGKTTAANPNHNHKETVA